VSETTLKRGRGSSLAQTVSRFVAGIVAEQQLPIAQCVDLVTDSYHPRLKKKRIRTIKKRFFESTYSGRTFH